MLHNSSLGASPSKDVRLFFLALFQTQCMQKENISSLDLVCQIFLALNSSDQIRFLRTRPLKPEIGRLGIHGIP
jgi:hypothetical protein